MSFFRVLLALLISGGIAYGLYTVVKEQKAERGSQTEIVAERAEIADTSATTTDAAEQEPASELDAPMDESTSSGEASFAERTAEAVEETDASTDTDANTTTSSLTSLPRPPEAPAVNEEATDTAEAVSTMPAATIADSTSDSVAALNIVTGGMTYATARETLVEAGWTPRAIEDRSGTPDATETTLIEAGYTELEGCSGAERAICRFEFVDGQKRIAAVLTAGSDGDPSVIDAFLMDIAKTE